MAGYMMKEEKNRVQLLVRVCGTSQVNASTACERFLQSAALLPQGEYLGWQMAINGDAVSNVAFSSPGVKIQEEDFAWIFEKYAAVKPCETETQTADLFSEGRKVYAFVGRPGEENKEESNKGGNYSGYGYENSARREHFTNLLEMLQDAGGAYLRAIAGAAPGKASGTGTLLLSLPGEITLRMRTVLSLVFPSAVTREVNPLEIGNPEGIPASSLLDGMIGLQQTFKRYKKQNTENADTENGSSTEERSSTGNQIEDEGCAGEQTNLRCHDELYYEEPLFANTYYEEDDICDDDLFDSDYSDITDEDDGTEYTPYTPIETLEFSVRTFNCLKRAGVESVEDLRMMSDEELMGVRNLGRKSIEEIKRALAPESAPVKAAPPAPVNYRAMLDELIGLANVKEQIKKIEAFARMKQDMEASGNQTAQMVLNMEFIGNPGTAKTTVARILAGIFHEIGLLSSAEILEVGRTDLVGLYIGHTADRVRSVFREAKGRLLFIDEAYSLTDDKKGSFGDEAINTIVQEMENHRQETIVIFAGYRQEMEEFFTRNPGLRSRTPFQISFEDYSAGEMEQIVELEAGRRGFTIQEQAKEKVTDICSASKAAENTGNGRFCRNLVEKAILNYAFRTYGGENAPAARDYVLAEADFTAEGLLEKKKETAAVGFRMREE